MFRAWLEYKLPKFKCATIFTIVFPNPIEIIDGTIKRPNLILHTMTKEQAIKLMGSVKALALLLEVSESAVSQWKTIPKSRLWQLQLLRPEWFRKVKQ